MKAQVKKLILCIVLTLMLCGTGLLLFASRVDRQSKVCDGLRVEFSDDNRFVTEADVKEYLDRLYPGYIGKRLDSLDLHRIEDILDDQSAILKSEAFVTPDSKLNVRISQRQPVLRFQKGDYGFYVDARGYIFPLNGNCPAKVPVIDGAVPVKCQEGFKGRAQTEREVKWIGDLIDMMSWVSRSRTWKEAIVQIAVNEDGDLVLVPRTGREKFIFGAPDDVPAKFSRIEKYYEYIKPAVQDSLYSSVNVKYDNQIICRK